MVANRTVDDFDKQNSLTDSSINDPSSCGIFDKPGSGHKALKDIPKSLLEELTFRRSIDFYKLARKIVNHLSEYQLQHLVDKNKPRHMLKREELITLSQDIQQAVELTNEEADAGLAKIDQELEELKVYKTLLLQTGFQVNLTRNHVDSTSSLNTGN